MPRIRSIKPEFWLDEKLARLTRDQRFFYIGLWNQADDEGRFRANPRLLLGAIFPYDEDLGERFIEDSLRAHGALKRIVLYEVDGERYGQIVRWHEHQKINRPTLSSIPSHDNELAELTEPSLSPHGALTVGKERKGKERKHVETLWRLWVARLGGRGKMPKLTGERRKVLARLYDEQLAGEADPDAVFAKVLDAVRSSEHHMSQRAYQMPESLFRNEERRDRWVTMALSVNGTNSQRSLQDVE